MRENKMNSIWLNAQVYKMLGKNPKKEHKIITKRKYKFIS